MKLKNCVVGTSVQIKDLNIKPTSDCSGKFSRYEVYTTDGWVISHTADEDGDVRITKEGYTNPFNGNKYLFVNHSNIRKVKES